MKLRVFHTGPGLLATIQDLGRQGALAHGVPFSGAMDAHSHALANLLLGNDPGAATLECSGGKLDAWVEEGGQVALAGAGGALLVDGQRVPGGRILGIPEGALIEIQPLPGGNFCYLATTGGWQVPAVFGSASTYLAGGFGGYEGRSLQKNDVLHSALNQVAPANTEISPWYLEDQNDVTPQLETPLEVGILQGPEWSLWQKEQQQLFLEKPVRISKSRSRQAVRLEALDFLEHQFSDMYSTGVSPGVIQIPPGDTPAILMSDAQTTGGFPRIAQVIAVDLPKIAQAKTGQLLRFSIVDIAEASRRLLAYERELQRMKVAVRLRAG